MCYKMTDVKNVKKSNVTINKGVQILETPS